ncbi:MAG TPA: hypothetical protein VF624_01540 [Tepidisphaeraceae bacterium]|jgi:hypothetical protein
MPLALTAAIVAVTLHAQWSSQTGAQLDARVQALRAAGEPVLPGDFARPGIDGAAAALKAALAKMAAEPSEAMGALDDCDVIEPPLTDFEAELIRDAVGDHADTLAAVRAAAGASMERPPVAIGAAISSLNPVRAAAGLVKYAALGRAHAGASDAAMRSADDLPTLARYAAGDESLIGHLVACGIDAMEVELRVSIAPKLSIGAAPPAVAPAAVRAAIDRLLDPTEPRARLMRALRGERSLILYNLTATEAQDNPMPVAMGLDDPVSRYVARPLLNTYAVACLDVMTEVIRCSAEADAPAFNKAMDGWLTAAAGRNGDGALFASIIVPGMRQALETQFRIQTCREAAATALAVRWYATEHDNNLPAKLEDLVPKYLPRLPRDYLATNAPLRYRPGKTPILWGVGENGRDDNGVEARPHQSVKEQRETNDEVFHLAARPRKGH